MNVALHNLGCSKNQIDGERMLQWLCEAGHRVVDDFARAELILVNTCAFIQEAKEEAIAAILQMASYKRLGRCRTLAVCGCFSQRYAGEAAAELPEVDWWFDLHGWQREFARLFGYRVPGSGKRRLTVPGPSQYLKISEGCSRRCSFCAIPAIRGRFRSREISDVVREARWLWRQGARECILVSQDSSSYGRDKGTDLVRLVEELLRRTSFPWLRLMYLHPANLPDALLRLMAAEERLCSYIDVPFQHASDGVLRRMRRRPLSRGMYALVEKIRRLVPDCAIRTSLIVGFPGETTRDMRELVRFLEWARLEKVGVFAYSPEEGTPSFAYRPRVRRDVAARRREMVLEVQRDISRDVGRQRVGKRVRVLLEGAAKAHGYRYRGRTQWDAPEVDGSVLVRSARTTRRALVTARVEDADDYDLYAALLD
jgi:ribosomal protein S12 methylthiotransferase